MIWRTGETEAFSPSLEVKISPHRHILPQVLIMGQEVEEACRKSKDAGTLPNRTVKLTKRRREERLKLRDRNQEDEVLHHSIKYRSQSYIAFVVKVQPGY